MLGYACVCKYEEFMNNVNCTNTDILYLGDETPLPENGVKATFVERPIIVQKDENVRIECTCVGDPKPLLTW